MGPNHDAKIIICAPAFNEAATISEMLTRSKRYADELTVYYVGSADYTFQVAVSAGGTVIRNHENKGYGVAIRSLFQAAKEQDADVMVTLDCDGQHNLDQIRSIGTVTTRI